VKKVIVLLGLIGLVAAAIAGVIFGLSIREVSCLVEGRSPAESHQVCEQLQELKGSRLLFRDFYQDSQTAKLLFVPTTKEAYDLERVNKSLAGVLELVLNDRPPLYRLEKEEQILMVTKAGGFRENNEQLEIPLVEDLADIYQEPTTHQFLASFLQNLGEERQQISKITLVNFQRIKVRVPGFPQILLELNQDPQQAAKRLAIILKRLDPQQLDLALQEIDLRFELPVLRTYESSSASQILIDR
jgi:hypothetical protein